MTQFDLSLVDLLDLHTLAAAIVDNRDDARRSILVRYACLAVLESRGPGAPDVLAGGVLAAGKARLSAGNKGEDLQRATQAANQVYLHVWGGASDGPSPSSPAAVENSSTVAG